MTNENQTRSKCRELERLESELRMTKRLLEQERERNTVGLGRKMKVKVIEIMERQIIDADYWIIERKRDMVHQDPNDKPGDADQTHQERLDEAIAHRDEMVDCLKWVESVVVEGEVQDE